MKIAGITILSYLKSPFMMWVSMLSVLATMQALYGRNVHAAGGFMLAAVVMLVVHFISYRKEMPVRVSLISLGTYLVPAVLVAASAAVKMPQEASAEEYREIEVALLYTRSDDMRRQIQEMARGAMTDGYLSRWEATELRQFVMLNTGMLMRSGAAATLPEARKRFLELTTAKITMNALIKAMS
ncbi:hypothetical protein D3981_004360 [Escherichia coli]|nr:hypothetical protein [Escherichia coli]